MRKSRSTAGSSCQTRTPDPVVSALELGILLSSVFGFLYLAVFCWFSLFLAVFDLPSQACLDEDSGQKEQ